MYSLVDTSWFLRRSTMLIVCVCWLIGGLTACSTPVETEEDIGNGSHNPQIVAERFFEDLNLALQDPQLGETEIRRSWAERLASHFAPSERTIQRDGFNQTLRNFAYNLAQLEDTERFTAEISYTTIEVVAEQDDLAVIRLVDGELHLKKTRVSAENRQEVLFDLRRPLTDVIGQTSGVFPVLRVNGRWFMTERQTPLL